MFGADVYASPSTQTEFGKKLHAEDPNHNGSLGIAISEGLEDAKTDSKAVYCLGSVLNHVLLHQSIIGLETMKQMEIAGEYPDIVISCLGGGSNFGGIAIPWMGEVLTKNKEIQFIAAQSDAAPNLQGEYKYDFASPSLKLGVSFVTDPGLTICFSGVRRLEQDEYNFGVGIQYNLSKFIEIYLGMNDIYLSTGITFKLFRLNISYAFAIDNIDYGYNNMVSITMLF